MATDEHTTSAPAETIFRDMAAIKGAQDPEAEFLRYCRDYLGSVEPLHFDYKEKKHAQTAELHDDDRANIAKAVSGFANAAGGVLIWGIEDGELSAKPISAVAEFMGRVQSLAGQCATPIVMGIDAAYIPSTSGGAEAGFGLLLVPQSQVSPHQVILKTKDVQHHYYIRTAGAFQRADHYQLEDMFGRRPKPFVSLALTSQRMRTPAEWELQLELRNEGRGTAKDIVLHMDMADFLKPSSHDPGHGGTFRNDTFAPRGKVGVWMRTALHPGMSETISGVILEESSRERYPMVNIRYRLYAENMRPVESILQFPFPAPARV